MGSSQWGEASPMSWHPGQHSPAAWMQKRDQAPEVKQPLCSVLLCHGRTHFLLLIISEYQVFACSSHGPILPPKGHNLGVTHGPLAVQRSQHLPLASLKLGKPRCWGYGTFGVESKGRSIWNCASHAVLCYESMKKREECTAVFLHTHASHIGPNSLCNAPGWYPAPLPCRTLPEPVLSPTASHPSSLIPGAVQDWCSAGITPGFCESHAETAKPGVTISMEACWAPKLAQPQFHLPAGATATLRPGAQSKTQHASSGAFAGFIVPFILAPKQTALSQASPFGKGSRFSFQVHPSILAKFPNETEVMG